MIGIHQIYISEMQSSYFIKRPFGNLLIFADNLSDLKQQDQELFSAYGGLSKIILESTQSINSTHRSLFRKYGSSVVCDTIKYHFDEGIKVERLKDIVEPQIEFIFKPHFKLIILEQDKKKIMFVGKDVKLQSQQMICQDHDISEKIFQIKQEKSIELIYFSNYQNEAALSFTERGFLSKIKSFFIK